MKIKRIFFSILVLFALCFTAAAQTSTKKSNHKIYTINVDFNEINSTLTDKEFSKKIAEDILRKELDRSGTKVRDGKPRNLHLSFVIDYVYHVGDSEYRFAHFHALVRDKSRYSLCDLGQSVWWGGPSGPGQIRSALSSMSRSFIEQCIK